ncbi:MAG: flagellar assembly peptidoglycan hydrolase FlgJ [Gammaproteobacteria bacterium]|jgi:flagellar protein FlgJ
MVAETQVSSYTDFSALTQLKARAGANDPRAVRDAARQFEALFLQMMLKSMRDAGSALAESRDRTYEEMFDQQIALELAQRDSLGIGDLLLRQIGTLSDVEASGAPPSQATQLVDAGPAGLSTTRRSDFRPHNAQSFVSEIWGLAQRTGDELGIDPRVIVAQAALETGWGNQLIRDNRGVSGNNLFGIKADEAWRGERIGVSTLEYEGARFVPRFAQFRAYPTLAEGFDGYRSFLTAGARYEEALKHGEDPLQFAQALQNAGYATDPEYATKIGRIVKSAQFAELIQRADGR